MKKITKEAHPIFEIGDNNYRGLTITIETDYDVESPMDWDNVGTLVCKHSRYTLGTEGGDIQVLSDIRSSRLYRKSWDDGNSPAYLDETYLPNLAKMAEECGFLILPLYLYDHSGITIWSGPFSCQWDSGQVGFIYVTPEKARKEYGWKRLTNDRWATALERLEAEVAVYDQYLRGDVWCYSIEDPDTGEVEGSCCGFYGLEHISIEACSDADSYLEDKEPAGSFAAFNKYQKALLEHYENGEFEHLANLEEAEEPGACGDGLVLFLLRELSTDEDCVNNEGAVRRLTTIERQVSWLLTCFKTSFGD